MMETEKYPAVVTGYGGVAMIHGSKVGGMANDNVRGMPTFVSDVHHRVTSYLRSNGARPRPRLSV